MLLNSMLFMSQTVYRSNHFLSATHSLSYSLFSNKITVPFCELKYVIRVIRTTYRKTHSQIRTQTLTNCSLSQQMYLTNLLSQIRALKKIKSTFIHLE